MKKEKYGRIIMEGWGVGYQIRLQDPPEEIKEKLQEGNGLFMDKLLQFGGSCGNVEVKKEFEDFYTNDFWVKIDEEFVEWLIYTKETQPDLRLAIKTVIRRI